MGEGQGDREALYRDLSAGAFAKSVPLFGSDIRISVGGYVKFDLLADFSGTGDRRQFTLSTIPVPDKENARYVNLQARETRMSFDIRHTGEGLPFNQGFVEFDFYGNEDPYGSLRLRHAYLRWGRLLAGRTWTILTDLNGLPYLIDFAYGDALYGGRTSQIRWEQPFCGGFKLTAGIELNDDLGIENVFELEGEPLADLPSVSVRGDYTWSRGTIMVGGSVGQLRWQGEGATESDTATQWAATVSGRVHLDRRRTHYVCGQIAGGEGAGGGIAAFGGQGAGAVLNAEGKLDPMPVWVGSLALHVQWSKRFSSNFAAAWTELDPAEDRLPDAMRAGGAAHANLIWQVATPFRVGVEVMYGVRRNTDGREGHAKRIQFMAMYSF